MKIALFTETYLPFINGVVTHVKLLKEGLESLGHTVLVVTADPGAKKSYIQDGVLHCPAVTSKRLYNYGLAAPLSYKRFRLIENFGPDIIHIHNEFGIGLSGIEAAKRLHIPLVYTMHTMYDEYLYYIAPRPLLPIVKKTAHSYAKFLANRASSLTGPSKKIEGFFKSCGVNKDVNIVPNSVELDDFTPDKVSPEQKTELRKKLNIPADACIACFVGRLGFEKSVDVLIDYWCEKLLDDEKLYLIVIGEGPAFSGLVEQANIRNASEKIKFLGAILHAEIPPYFAICDMFITPSLSDTNSISMLEAMASGLPVLQRYDEINANQVVEGINGFIFNNAEEMANKVLAIKNKTTEEINILKHSVRDSVKKSGAEDLANYMLAVYSNSYYVSKREQREKTKDELHKKMNKITIKSKNKKE
ncbi:MAG: glycosyltransferase [Oscillospiraceae bacterium]